MVKVLQKETWGQGQSAAGRKFTIRGFSRKTEARVLQKRKLRLWRFRKKFEAKVFQNEIWDQAASKKRIRFFRKKALRRESWDLETSEAKLRRRFKREKRVHGALERNLRLEASERKMKPWRFRKKAESKVRQKEVHKEGLRPSSFCYSINHALSIILVFNG